VWLTSFCFNSKLPQAFSHQCSSTGVPFATSHSNAMTTIRRLVASCIVVGTWTCPDPDGGPRPSGNLGRSRTCSKTYDLWTCTAAAACSNLGVSFCRCSRAVNALLEYSHGILTALLALQLSIKPVSRGVYVIVHVISSGEGQSDRSQGPGPGPVRKLKSAGPDYYGELCMCWPRTGSCVQSATYGEEKGTDR